MRLPLTIEGIDCSNYANINNYNIGYKAIQGNNGGIMLDGSTTVDVLAYKCVITLDLNSMTGIQLSTILTAILKPYVTVTYFDTLTNANRTAVFMPEIGSSRFAFFTDGSKRFDSGTTLVLTER